MSKIDTNEVICPNCNTRQKVTVVQSINATSDPELRDRFFKKDINIFKCSNCDTSGPIGQEVLYHDMDNSLSVLYGPNGVSKETRHNWEKTNQLIPYFNYTFFAESEIEAIVIVQYCEKNGAPKNVDERDSIHQFIKQLLSKLKEENIETDSNGNHS
jgi:hypothetical protein